MALFTVQTIAGNFDPATASPPQTISVVTMEVNDNNDDGVIRPLVGADRINGSLVIRVFNGDTITVDGTEIPGVTFYTLDGSRYFASSDGSLLPDGGEVTATTFVTDSTSFPVSDFGPPCFVAGTRIRVPGGTVPVETLKIGDLVETRDHGPRPVRWAGRRTVPGQGAFAPVHIAAGALGEHNALRVSPQHRILLGGWRAQLYTGEDEVLCAANLLVNGDTITRAPCDAVTYVHIMFDAHEIVDSEGLPSESFCVGAYLCHDSSALRAEISAVFPELDDGVAAMTTARRVVRGREAALLRPAGACIASAVA